VPDFQHKLWDQLFIIADFDLDVDSPYPIPDRDELFRRPERLPYPQNHPKYRFYGNNIKTMIDVAITWEEGDLKDALVYTIANHMKKCFLNWNKDTVEDDVILAHLAELSNNQLTLKSSFDDLSDANSLLKTRKKYTKKNKRTQHTNRTNRKRY
jgi:hypothetical protein